MNSWTLKSYAAERLPVGSSNDALLHTSIGIFQATGPEKHEVLFRCPRLSIRLFQRCLIA